MQCDLLIQYKLLFRPVKMKENTAQPDTGAIAAQAVANAAAVEAAG
jgi:hypothetical protein